MARTPKEPAAAEPASYEAAVSELEALVNALEGGQMPLDRLLVSYRRGAELLDYCRARLRAVEEQVRVIDDARAKDGSTG